MTDNLVTFYTQILRGRFCTRVSDMFPKAGFTDIGNTVLLTSKLREVHSCTAHDIVQLGVYTELNISNVEKLQFLDDKEIKIKLCWLLVISTGGEAQLYTDEWTSVSVFAPAGPTTTRSHHLATGSRSTRLAPAR